MIEKKFTWEYDDGYVVGFDDGRNAGFVEGYNEAVADYKPRLQRYWAELATLNARIDYLERHTGLEGTNNVG